jgi:hypothetical protein
MVLVLDECHVGEAIWGYLGAPDERIGMENARLTGREIQVFVADEYPVALGYAQDILRKFREEVLLCFFHIYPDAMYIKDWRNLSLAVKQFTTNLQTQVGWLPTRKAVLDAVQKAKLLNKSQRGLAKYHPASKTLRYTRGKTVRQVKIKPASRSKVDTHGISTIMRTPCGLSYYHEIH